METTSNKCLSKVQELLDCRSNADIAKSFERNEAQMFVDFLDRVSRMCPIRERYQNDSMCRFSQDYLSTTAFGSGV